MTNEDMERAIEFLTNQQAQFFSDLEGLKAVQAETGKQIDKLAKVQADMQEQAEVDRKEVRQAVETMLRIAETMQANVLALTQAQQGNSQRIAKIEEHVNRPKNDQEE